MLNKAVGKICTVKQECNCCTEGVDKDMHMACIAVPYFEKRKNFSIPSADPVILKAESVPYAALLLCNLNNTSAFLRLIEKQGLEA